jgi:hypothetical protein
MRQEVNMKKVFEKMEVRYVGQVNEVVQVASAPPQACVTKRGAAPDGCTDLLQG